MTIITLRLTERQARSLQTAIREHAPATNYRSALNEAAQLRRQDNQAA